MNLSMVKTRGLLVAAATAAAAVMVSTGAAHADATDDAYVQELGSHGITLPASVQPSNLGHSVCDYMNMGASIQDATKNLLENGFQGMTFNAHDVSYVTWGAHTHYCPNTPVTGRP
jgi:ABC-type sugar transport system substrate-binding protein